VNPTENKRIILLVDDAPENIQVAHAILKDVYKTRVALNGLKAIEQAMVEPRPDLILLDVMMPGMDGYEVCARLKADAETRDIPVIFLTSRTEAADETRGFAVGAVDYIHKPFSPPVVLARVKTQLNLREAKEQLVSEKQLVDRILANILPEAAVREIKQTGGVEPRLFNDVAVLFIDLVSFTNYCDRHSAEEVVGSLESLFVFFEECARRNGLEKIKTIGDAFLATAGLLAPVGNPLEAAVQCALEIIEGIAKRGGRPWQVRAGVHSGPVMAGIVGREKFQFDVWGDTVNVASRLTSAGTPQCVTLTAQQAAGLAGRPARSRGSVELKGKGAIELAEIAEPTSQGM
jgi:class 3 adenylate cyclase